MQKQIPVLLAACLTIMSAVAQRHASYYLAGGAFTNEASLTSTGGKDRFAITGAAFTAEAGIRFHHNTLGGQYLARLNDDIRLITNMGVIYGRMLVDEKRFNCTIHTGLSLEREGGVLSNSLERQNGIAVPLYADLRFGLSGSPESSTSFWIGLRGGRYFSTLGSFNLAQLNLVVVAPW